MTACSDTAPRHSPADRYIRYQISSEVLQQAASLPQTYVSTCGTESARARPAGGSHTVPTPSAARRAGGRARPPGCRRRASRLPLPPAAERRRPRRRPAERQSRPTVAPARGRHTPASASAHRPGRQRTPQPAPGETKLPRSAAGSRPTDRPRGRPWRRGWRRAPSHEALRHRSAPRAQSTSGRRGARRAPASGGTDCNETVSGQVGPVQDPKTFDE